MILRCIAIDDEPLAIEKLSGYMARVPFLSNEGCFLNPLEAMAFLHAHEIDLMFLDIQMDELTGIQLLEILKTSPKVIITSAYDQYALKGYELDVSDYLLKPFNFERFMKAVNKVYESCRSTGFPTQKLPDSSQSDYIFFKDGSKIERVNIFDILYVEGMKEYLRIHTATSQVLTLMSFKKLEELLPPGKFIRIHKSFLIALDKIQRVENQQVTVAGKQLQIGDTYKSAFYEIIRSFIH
jgi:DNA-binding LytR/AlgR family response regulator